MNTLETKVLQIIGESTSSPDVFTDDSTGMAQIRESLNDAIEEICMVTGSKRRTYHIPLEEDAAFYKITSERDRFAWAVSVWLVDQKRQLEQTDFVKLLYDNWRFLYRSGTPLRYYMIGVDKIGLDPIPSADSDMLEVRSVVIPDRYTIDTDRIKIRAQFQWAAVHYAVSEYFASRGDVKRAVRSFYKYLEQIGLQELYPEYAERQWEYKTVKR